MKIKLKNKTKTVFTVYIENEIWGTLPGRVLRFFSIFPDRENILPDEKKNELIQEIEKYHWNKLLNFLTYRERSVWECRNYLQQQQLSSPSIEKLLKKAMEKNFVNDKRFAEMYVQDLISKDRNEKQIRSKLMEKHIPQNLLETVISEQITSEQKSDILDANYKKAVSRFSCLPEEKRKEKILNYLTRKGFSYWEIKQEMEEEGY